MAVYAFIDSQNLNLGVQSAGWQLDYRKFRQYLSEKYGVSQASVFIGYRPDNKQLYASLQKKGYSLVFKPAIRQADGTIKGNVDAELVLHAMLQYPNYDQAIIVSGDGDFLCLIEHLAAQHKLLRILAPNEHYSGLLRRFSDYVIRVDKLRYQLEFKPTKKTRTGGRSKP